MDAVLELSEMTPETGIVIAHILGGPSGQDIGVRAVGDVDGDGVADFLVTEFDSFSGDPGRQYFVGGTRAFDFNGQIDLDDIPESQIIVGTASGGGFGWSGAAGDFNGDGKRDVAVATPFSDPAGTPEDPATPGAGGVVLVLGSDSGLPSGTATPDGMHVVAINGINEYDNAGWSIDFCDVDGDGFDDLFIGVPGLDENGENSGGAYVWFGTDQPLPVSIDLSELDGTNGGRFVGLQPADRCGWSVADLGDINGDGYSDCAIGAPGANPGGENNAGATYVKFGAPGSPFTMPPPNGSPPVEGDPAPGTFDLTTLDGNNGFTIIGADGGDNSGQSVAAAGDVNGDGFNDILIGADGVDVDGPDGFAYQGAAYVVFGSDAGFGAVIDLGALDGSNGFRMHGPGNDSTSQVGYSVASAGDYNGDGFDDMLIGGPRSRPTTNTPPHGAVFVVFGSAEPFAADFDLATLDGTNGFRLNAAAALDYTGSSVTGLGDVNGDGFDDIGMSGFGADVGYIVYGQSTVPPIVGTAGDNTLHGGAGADDISGLAGNDRIFGLAGLDTLRGGAGDDRLDGGIGADRLAGGADDDVYFVDNSGDRVFEGLDKGTDAIRASVTFTLSGNVENLYLTGGANIDGFGNALENIIIGNAGNNILNGRAGEDYMAGGLGNDAYIVDNAGDRVSEQPSGGTDRVVASVDFLLSAHVENLVLAGSGDLVGRGNGLANIISGNAGANSLDGGGGNDRLVGGQGNDWLVGGSGLDVLIGGSGPDRFVFRSAGDFGGLWAAADLVADFSSVAGDRIHLAAIDADSTSGGNQAFTFIGTAGFSQTAGELRIGGNSSMSVVQGDWDGDGVADFMIRVAGSHTLTAGDFVL